MSSIKEKIAQILKDAFDVAPVITPAAPAVLAAPVVPPAAPVPYTLADGTAILIAQAGQVPAVGDMVTNADGSIPVAGVLTLQDGSTLTVDASGAITEVGAAVPVTTDLAGAPPVPTLEERITAIENAIAKAVQPARMAEVTKEEFEAVKKENEKLTKVFKELTGVVAEIGSTPTAEPETLTGNRKDRYDRQTAKDEKLAKYADLISKNKALS